MLDYDFVIYAFAAAGIAAIVSAIVGYFLVNRGQTFAGHALSHVGFAGATGAALSESHRSGASSASRWQLASE
jgi:zinc/manganese transport system permease protein